MSPSFPDDHLLKQQYNTHYYGASEYKIAPVSPTEDVSQMAESAVRVHHQQQTLPRAAGRPGHRQPRGRPGRRRQQRRRRGAEPAAAGVPGGRRREGRGAARQDQQEDPGAGADPAAARPRGAAVGAADDRGARPGVRGRAHRGHRGRGRQDTRRGRHDHGGI